MVPTLGSPRTYSEDFVFLRAFYTLYFSGFFSSSTQTDTRAWMTFCMNRKVDWQRNPVLRPNKTCCDKRSSCFLPSLSPSRSFSTLYFSIFFSLSRQTDTRARMMFCVSPKLQWQKHCIRTRSITVHCTHIEPRNRSRRHTCYQQKSANSTRVCERFSFSLLNYAEMRICFIESEI